MKSKSTVKELLEKLGTVLALLILIVVFCVVMPDKFPRIGNIMNILKQASINCLIASGMLCALITAGIDLSVGSNCVLCTCTIGVLVQNFGVTNALILAICGLAVSTFAGFINGTLLTRLDLPHPFVSTMGMKNVLLGVALVITGSKSIAFTNTGVDALMWIGGGSVLKFGTFPGIPVSFILVILVFILFDIFLKKSALGRQIYCCGGNPEAASVSGISVFKVTVGAFIMAGILYGFGSWLECIRMSGSGSASYGQGWEMDAIAACVVGGVSFTGGIGKISGVVTGVFIFTALTYSLTTLGIDANLQFVFSGIIILVAVMLDCLKYVQKK